MAIDVTCPHCGMRTKVHARYAGTSGPCRNCDQVLSVPAGNPTGNDTAQSPVSIPGRISRIPPLKDDRADDELPLVFRAPGCLPLIVITVAVHTMPIPAKPYFIGLHWLGVVTVLVVTILGKRRRNASYFETEQTRRQILADQIAKKDAKKD